MTDALNKSGGGGSVTLYRHAVMIDFMEFTAAEGGTSPDNGLEGIYLGFDYYSTSATPLSIVSYGENTLQGFYNFIVDKCGCDLTVSGSVVVNGEQRSVCTIDAYGNSMTFFGASNFYIADITSLKGDWSSNDGWDTVTQVT